VSERVSAAALETELTRSKLDALRSQLRPHFLFNTLNAISGLMPEGADKPRHMLLRLSSLLRRSLDEEAHEVPLQQELAFLNDYLDIQRVRFGSRLTVQLAVDPAVLPARVPVFLLQPLLENAIEHGEGDDGRTTIALSAARDGDVLHVTVEDDGPGIAISASMREGVGLRNTRDGEGLLLLEPSQVDWIESAGNYVRVHSGARAYLTRTTMDRVARRLTAGGNFIRVRRSALINVRAIAKIERYGKGTFVVYLRNGAKVISGRFYHPELRRLLRPEG
jgi:sensor histidine kinase regulating citrate/malate metabolism